MVVFLEVVPVHVTVLVVWCMEEPVVQVSYRMQRSSYTVMVTSVKMEALVVGTHAPVHLGTQENFAPLASLHALLVISSTSVPAAVVSVILLQETLILW